MSDETERNLKFKMGRTEANFYEKSAQFDKKLSDIYENSKEARAQITKQMKKHGAKAVLKAVERNSRNFGATKGNRVTSLGREERQQAKESREKISQTFKEMREAYDERAVQGEALDRHHANSKPSKEKKLSKKVEKKQEAKQQKTVAIEPRLQETTKQDIHANQLTAKDKAKNIMEYLAEKKEARQKAKDGATPDAAFAKLEADKKKNRQRDNEWEPE